MADRLSRSVAPPKPAILRGCQVLIGALTSAVL